MGASLLAVAKSIYYYLYDEKYFGPKAKGCFRDHDTHFIHCLIRRTKDDC